MTQTIYVRPDATEYEAVCEECLAQLERPARRHAEGARLRGSLRLEADVGFTCCRRGHRIRARRVARPLEPAAPRPVPLRYGNR